MNEMVAETKRLFRLNREGNLVRKIAHLKAHGLKEQAKGLEAELKEWRAALAADEPEPEQTVTTALDLQVEAETVEMPERRFGGL